MNNLVATFLLLIASMMLFAPRRVAPLALIVCACSIPVQFSLHFGPFNFTALRMVMAMGLIRMAMRGEYPVRPLNAVDRMMALWALWLLLSSVFHENPGSAFVFRLGLAYDALGIYLLVRSYCRSMEDVTGLVQLTALALVPLAVMMLYEKTTNYNAFSLLSGVGEQPLVRDGTVRASGPFGHPILAGTVGAVCLPLMCGLWNAHRARALLGMAACIAIIASSGSSGPILSAAAGALGLYLWRQRNRMRRVQWLAVCLYLLLDLVMKDPAYFLIARVDLTGGSTSWYRARLIQSALQHLPEWWFAGTDNTREWMWVVVAWSTKHTDITSHYIQLGVWGGLPLMLMFIATVFKAFAVVTRGVAPASALAPASKYMLWSVGASLFAIAVTGLSVSYFDQSILFVYLVIGILGTMSSVLASLPPVQPAPARPVAPIPAPRSDIRHRRFI